MFSGGHHLQKRASIRSAIRSLQESREALRGELILEFPEAVSQDIDEREERNAVEGDHRGALGPCPTCGFQGRIVKSAYVGG